MSKKRIIKMLGILAFAVVFFYYAESFGANEAKKSEPVQESAAGGGFVAPEDKLLAAREAEAGRIEAFRKTQEERGQTLKAAQMAREEAARARSNGSSGPAASEEEKSAAKR